MSTSSHSCCGCCRGQSISPPTYSPLEADQIRVLRILPTAIPGGNDHYHQNDNENDYGKEDFCIECDMIRCELVTVSLKEVSGAFDALSYVWGYASVKEQIKMDGKIIEVTPNLEAALRRIRNTERAELLWVDALCINQQDVEEKNIQVMRMKDIYTMCARVLVWLGDVILDGPGNDNDEVAVAIKAIAFLKKAHRLVRGKDTIGKQYFEDWSRSKADTQPFDDPSTVGLPAVGSPEWDYLSKFLSRPWFSRVWIIQEASGVDHTLLMVGKDSRLGWGQLSQVLNWLLAHDYQDNIDGLSALHNFTMIETCRRYKYVPLMHRLDLVSRFNSTVPHDKIYAVLGLSIECLTPEKYPRLRVDYARDSQAVFRDVTRHCIEMPGSFNNKSTLHVLSSVRHERDNDGNFVWDIGQSSWVPKWDTTHDNYCTIVQRKSTLAFQTTYDTEPCIVDSQDDRILSLKGIIVDKIAKVYTHLVDVSEDHDLHFSLSGFRAVIRAWKAIAWDSPWRSGVMSRYPLLGEAFAKIVTEGYPCGPPGTGSHGQYFSAYWEVGLVYAKEEEQGTLPRFSTFFAPTKRDIEKWPSVEGESSEETLERLTYLALRFNMAVSFDRTIFVTETGYIGSGPPITKAGDEICVLYGGKTPFVVQKVVKGPDCPEWLDLEAGVPTSSAGKFQGVLKKWKQFQKKKPEEYTQVPAGSHHLPRTNCYRLVGECYVEGLQKGKAIDLRDKGDLHETVLHLI